MELIWEVTNLASSYNEYCVVDCKSKCCKHGKLPLSSSELDLFDKSRIDNMGAYDLNGGCEHLSETGFCRIYSKRPQMCRIFPFVLKTRTIYANSFCPGIENDIFYNPEKITTQHLFIKI